MRAGGNRDLTLKIFTDHNHLFLKDPNGSISGYEKLLWHTNKLPDAVLSTITGWLSEQLAEK